MNDLQHFIKLGVQFAYPFYWKRWDVLKYYSITFKFKNGIITGNKIETIFKTAEFNLPNLSLTGIGNHHDYVGQTKHKNVSLILDDPYRACKGFRDNSVDFVFIEDIKNYTDMLLNIDIWKSKVHEYGLLMGANYNWGDVARAVGETFTEVWILPDNVWAASTNWFRETHGQNSNR